MRFLLGLALVLAACGGPAKKVTTSPNDVVAPPPPPPFDVATSPSINALATDATHLYWADDQGIYRRPLGPGQKAERLFAATYVSLLAPGAQELFFVDEEARVRAVAMTGGQAREVDAPEDTPWALYAEHDAVWYALGEQLIGISPSGRRTIDIVGASVGVFAAADGAAYVVRYDEGGFYHLDRIDLANATATEVSHADFLGDATALALIGGEIVVLVGDGAVAVPLDGGQPHRAFYGAAGGVAADASGYAVGGYGFVVTHARNQPPRLVATGTMQDTVTATNSIAVAGDYVYYTASSNETGDMILRAAARAGGAVLMRLPVDAAVSALAATPDAVYAGIEDSNGTGLFQVGTKKVKLLAPSGWIEQLVAGDPGLVAIVDGSMLGIAPDHGEMSVITEAPYTPVVLHKGKAYWGEGSVIRAAALPRGDAFTVIDVSTFDESWMDQQIGAVAFANDHLYFVINVDDRQGIAQLDEARQLSWLWTWTQDPDDDLTLDPSIVAVGDRLYVHDGTFAYQVGLDGTSKRIYDGSAKGDDDVPTTIAQLFPAGERLIAKVYTDGEELIEIPTEGGQPRSVWSSSLDGSYLGYVAVSPTAVFLHVSDLMAILKIPLD